MFDRITEFLGLKPTRETAENGLALATAALLVQVSMADGEFSAEERAGLMACLTGHFGLPDNLARDMLARAERDLGDAPSLYDFTRVVTKELDQDERQEIVRLLWRVALADNHLDTFEANAVAKIAHLLGVATHDRVRLKHEVEAEG